MIYCLFPEIRPTDGKPIKAGLRMINYEQVCENKNVTHNLLKKYDIGATASITYDSVS